MAEPRPAVVNIAAHLSQMAARYPHKRAVVCPVGHDSYDRVAYSHLTFRQLEQEADRYAHGLQRAGLTRGMRAILMVRPGPEFFALTFALFKIGAVPVLIDPGIGRRNLVSCLANVRAEAFIGVPLAHALRTLYRQSFRTVRIAVTVGTRYFWGGLHVSDVRHHPWQPFDPAPTRADEPAAILFTSGSTGPPKGVVYEHGMFDAQVRYLRSHYGYAPDEVDLATFPLFALFDAALGMTAVIPDMDATRPGAADPVKLVETIHNQGCTHMFGSPALLERLARYGERTGATLPALKRVMTAGAPVRPALLRSLRKMLSDQATVHTPYGATESLPVTDITDAEILADTHKRTAAAGGTCVGRPLDGMHVRIIAITDERLTQWADARQLPAGEIGEIVVKGPVVTRTYFGMPAATTAAKINDESDGAVWHRMGDVGYFDDAGRLWFCGRKAHRVTAASGTLFTIPCEAVFNQHPQAFRTALVGVGAPGDMTPVLCVELETDAARADRSRITRELLELGAANALTSSVEIILFHNGFPVDVRHNAKIFREKLADWAARQLR